MIEIDEFMFDKNKFILSVHNGDIYKTKHTSSEVINNHDFLTVSSKFTYKINRNFILDNLDILMNKKIVFVNIKSKKKY